MKRWLVIVFFGVTSVFAQKPPVNTFEVYPIGLSDGPAMEQMAKAIVGPEGTVTLDANNHRLLVLATPEQHKKISDMVSKTAVTPKNVRIDVAFNGGEVQSEKGASVNGQAGVQRDEGITHVMWKMKPQVIDRSIETSSESRQQLLVSSGHEAKLRVGESVPYQTWLTDYGMARGFIPNQIAWREVGSFLVVKPTVIGDGPQIRVRVTPELSGMVNGSPYETRFASVSTEVVVNDGQTVTIGTDGKNSDFYSRFLIGATRSGGTRNLTITMTPRIYSLQQNQIPAGRP